MVLVVVVIWGIVAGVVGVAAFDLICVSSRWCEIGPRTLRDVCSNRVQIGCTVYISVCVCIERSSVSVSSYRVKGHPLRNWWFAAADLCVSRLKNHLLHQRRQDIGILLIEGLEQWPHQKGDTARLGQHKNDLGKFVLSIASTRICRQIHQFLE